MRCARKRERSGNPACELSSASTRSGHNCRRQLLPNLLGWLRIWMRSAGSLPHR
jgi:hypothetical protein